MASRSRSRGQKTERMRYPDQLTVALALLGFAGCGREKGRADLVLRGGEVYTVDAARSWASAIAVRDGRVVYVGSDSLPRGLIGPGTEIVELAGAMVLPGFQDAHVHPISSGVELVECHLHSLTTAVAVLDSIRACALARTDRPWVRGSGWQLPIFPGGNPSRVALDRAVPDRPALFYAADGHSAWLNSRALVLAGITRHTADPANGRIERDPRSGEPSGTLRESAMKLVERVIPQRTRAELAAGLDRAQREANGFGITSIFAATADEPDLATYADADRAGTLSLRVVAAAYSGEQVDSILPHAQAWRTRYATPRVRPTAVKLFQDGVIEARTAALLAPYLDRAGDAGTPIFDQPTLDRLTADLDRDGFQVHVHAIGDRAIRMTLDAFAHARERNGLRDARHAITHLELIDPADLPRFRALGVVANFQALWANGDDYLTKLTEPALGPARSRWLYPIASVVRTGAIVTGGSDWSVSSLNPLEAIEVGITHRDSGDSIAAAWNPAERVDLPTMIALYTINAAWALHQEKETGSIEPGKLADLVVLDRNLFQIPADRIHEARVMRTLLEGKTVYQAGAQQQRPLE